MAERSLHVLLRDIVDYAGLYPPAQLELDPAIRNYARYRGEPEAWMLGRFVCPTTKLAALAPYQDELFAVDPPFRFTVLTRGGESKAAYFDGLAADVAALREFAGRHGNRVRVDAMETRLPADLVSKPTDRDLLEFIERYTEAFAAFDGQRRPTFFELPLTGEWKVGVAALASALERHNASVPASAARYGFKLRTGGLEASAFPTPQQVATVLSVCVRAGVPMKFTAGLHHPIRRHDAGVRAAMHGFINVFLAATLCYSLHLELPDIVAILEEMDPTHFHFTEEFCGWDQADATLGELEYARKHVALAFGSCSFDEPRDDLRALRWL